MRDTFRSLRTRNFRLHTIGQLVSMAGTQVQAVAQSWLVLELSNGSGAAVGAVTACQYLPTLLLGPWAGVLIDRRDKRRTTILLHALMTVNALALAWVTLAGDVEIWMVLLAATFNGLCTVVDTPLRQAFVTELVPVDDLTNAVSLNSAVFNAARVVGPAVAGTLLVTLGAGACFVVNGATFLAVIAAVGRMRPEEIARPRPITAARGQIREGLRYVREHRRLRANLLMTAVVGTFTMNFVVILPVHATETYGGGAGDFSAMTIFQGVGAIVAALVLAARSTRSGDIVVRSGVGLGLSLVLVAVAPNLALCLVAMAAVGWSIIMSLSSANALCQLDAAPSTRGRVTSLRTMALFGGAPLGALGAGYLTDLAGPRAALIAAGLAAIVAALAWSPDLASRPKRIHVLAGGRFAPHEAPESIAPTA